MPELDFPPTETINWMRCPTYWRFNKEWVRRDEKWTPNRMMGKAVGEALASWFKHEADLVALDTGRAILTSEFEEQDSYTKEGLLALLERCFEKVVKTTAKEILDAETVIATEQPIGRGRPDLVTRSKVDNGLIVTDHKSKLTLDSKYVNQELVDTEGDWQLYDYAWRVSRFYGELVRAVRKHLIVFSPRPKAYLHLVPLEPMDIANWEHSAALAWKYMDADASVPYLYQLVQRQTECKARTWGAANEYRCPAYKVCHMLHRNEERMESLYQRRRAK